MARARRHGRRRAERLRAPMTSSTASPPTTSCTASRPTTSCSGIGDDERDERLRARPRHERRRRLRSRTAARDAGVLAVAQRADVGARSGNRTNRWENEHAIRITGSEQRGHGDRRAHASGGAVGRREGDPVRLRRDVQADRRCAARGCRTSSPSAPKARSSPCRSATASCPREGAVAVPTAIPPPFDSDVRRACSARADGRQRPSRPSPKARFSARRDSVPLHDRRLRAAGASCRTSRVHNIAGLGAAPTAIGRSVPSRARCRSFRARRFASRSRKCR